MADPTTQNNGKEYRVKEGKTFHGFNGYKAKARETITRQHPSFIAKGLRFDELEEVKDKKQKERKESKESKESKEHKASETSEGDPPNE